MRRTSTGWKGRKRCYGKERWEGQVQDEKEEKDEKDKYRMKRGEGYEELMDEYI